MNATGRLSKIVLWMLLLTLPALGFTTPAHKLCPETGMAFLAQHSHEVDDGMALHPDHHGQAVQGHHQPPGLTDLAHPQDPCPDCSQCLLPAIVLNDRGLAPDVGGSEPLARAPLLPETPNLDLTGPPPRRSS